MSPQASLRPPTAQAQTRACPAPRRWLVVEPMPAPALPFAPQDRVVHAHFDHLGPPLMARVLPDIVLAPLIAPRWDILDLAARLSDVGYTGLLVARSRPLPSTALVLHEIRGLFPELAVMIHSTPG